MCYVTGVTLIKEDINGFTHKWAYMYIYVLVYLFICNDLNIINFDLYRVAHEMSYH